MAASRLTDCQKSELLEGYRSGRTTKSLAEQFACSPITVNRTVKALLPPAEYVALKAARARGEAFPKIQNEINSNEPISSESQQEQEESDMAHIHEKDLGQLVTDKEKSNEIGHESKNSHPIAQLKLNDGDNFSPTIEDNAEYEVDKKNESIENIFHEVVPLANDFNPEEQKDILCQPLSPDVLPNCVYMLVDKTVELDIKYLKDLSELGELDPKDKNRQALYLFSNQRSAKRVCGRTQRVIKVPDSSVFEVSKHFLLAKGITRLVIEGSLISLDSEQK